MNEQKDNDNAVLRGLRHAESIRNLDPNTGLKIALALAGTYPELFSKLLEVAKHQNLVPASTLVLNPVPTHPARATA